MLIYRLYRVNPLSFSDKVLILFIQPGEHDSRVNLGWELLLFERSESAVMHAKLPTSRTLREESMNKFWKWWGVAVNGDRSLRSTARLFYAPSIGLVHTAKENSLNNFLNSHKWPVLQKKIQPSVPDYNEPLSSPIHAWAYNGFLQGGMHAVMEGEVPLSRRLITEALAPLWKWWMDMSPNWQCNQGGYMPFVLHSPQVHPKQVTLPNMLQL